VEIRTLDSGDVDGLHDLRVRAFGPMTREPRSPANLRSLAEGRVLGVYDGPRLIASAAYHAMEQWWHGRAVPMGGISGVCVAPEDRGRGVGRRLAAALLDLVGERPLSALYPATAPVYRAVGYEHAGAQHRITLAPEALRTLARHAPVKVRRVGPGDAAEVRALLRRVHADAGEDGPIDPGEEFLRDALADDDVYSYLAEDGFLAYSWQDGNRQLAVRRCVAGSAGTARALWAIVGTGSSIAQTVRANVSPGDPLLWLLRERSEDHVELARWMLRVIDAPAAVAARGFPAGVSLAVPLALEDEQRPGNAGSWRLTVEAGTGRLERAAGPERDAVRLPARGLAALYAGVPMATLRRAELAGGGEVADPLLDAAFAANPYMLDYF
jgi:predicted acetyltransferase